MTHEGERAFLHGFKQLVCVGMGAKDPYRELTLVPRWYVRPSGSTGKFAFVYEGLPGFLSWPEDTTPLLAPSWHTLRLVQF